jgi:serine/threonine-protein kinase HipA
MSTVQVKIWNKVVGYLYWDEQNSTSVFEIDKEYKDSDFNISPILLDKSVPLVYGNEFDSYFKGLPPCFHDSLADNFGNRVFNEWLSQNNIDQSELNPVERLLYVGVRGMGALEYLPSKDIPNAIHTIDLEELSKISELIIKNKYEHSDFLENPLALEQVKELGSFVGGAQPKLLIAIDKKGVIKPGDIMYDNLDIEYYIAKLSYNTETAWGNDKNKVEFVYNEIAREIGINVADSMLLESGGDLHFASKRFDRVKGEKLHTQTLNAISGFYGKVKTFNYEDAFSYMEQMEIGYSAKEQLFLQMVFNVSSCNMDDHTKNFSFIMDKQGKWDLSPAYDLTYPFDPYAINLYSHKIAINGKRKNITNNDLLAVAKVVGIKNASNLIDKVVGEVGKFKTYAKSHNISNKTIVLIDKHIQKTINNLKGINKSKGMSM